MHVGAPTCPTMNNLRRASTLADAPSRHLSLSIRSLPARLAGGASLLTALSLALPGGALATTPPTESATFTPTGAEQTFTVPAGVTSVHVQAIGAAGHTGATNDDPNETGAPGGVGADVTGVLPVTPGETLYVEVAGDGLGGGGAPGIGGGEGGGASDVRTVSSTLPESLESRLLVAAGGGGGGGAWDLGSGGAGGNAGTDGATGEDGRFEEGSTGGAGGAGTLTGGGAGSTLCAGSNGWWGTAGALGLGGAGGAGVEIETGGGGGGGGYWGGGGGEGACPLNPFAGGGGGGGSSYAVEDAKAVTVGLASASTEPSVTISYETPATATPNTDAVSFPGIQPQGTVSAPQTITLANSGGTPLELASATLVGSTPALETDHPEDFLVDSSGCLGKVPFESSCQVTVRFDPQGPGASTATLQIAGNMGAGPTTVALSGTGGALPADEAGVSGHEGVAGSAGQRGERGPQGQRGPQGYPAVYECHPRQGDGRFQVACYVRILSGGGSGVTTGTQSLAKLTLRRDGHVYARGFAGSRHGHELLMWATRRVAPGRYKLVLASGHTLAAKWVIVG